MITSKRNPFARDLLVEMNMKQPLLKWVLTLCAMSVSCGVLVADDTAAPLRVVGYLPDYRVAGIDPAVGSLLTDVVFFAIDPQPGKPLQHPRWNKAQPLLSKWKRDHGVRVTMSLGGWNRSTGFAKIASTAESRASFAAAALKLCQDDGLDGVDLDWEHPKGAREEADYAALILELKRVLQPHNLTVTAAVAGWQNLPKEGWQALDAVHLMAYDGPGQHSTYDAAVADVQRLIDKGVPADRIRLGLPFYGRGIKSRDKTLTYAEIVKQHSPAPEINEIDGVYFNGPDLIRLKTKYAAEKQLGGVMIWEIGQDAAGNDSLLRVIRRTFQDPK